MNENNVPLYGNGETFTFIFDEIGFKESIKNYLQ
jgi:hypothetical protein